MLSKEDSARLEFGKKHYKLEKFDGQKLPGDNKKPVEIIEYTEGEKLVHIQLRNGSKISISTDEFNRLIKDNPTKMISDQIDYQQSLNFTEE